MIEVTIDRILVSLMSRERIVILRDPQSGRYLPIWVGEFEADAISWRLQRPQRPERPMTHDLLKAVIDELDGNLECVIVDALRNDVFHALLVVLTGDRRHEIDARASDAIALAVRAGASIYVRDEVMGEAGIREEQDISGEGEDDIQLGAFQNFLDSLDLDDLDEKE